MAAAVPEPGTWALMLVGFGSIGAALRRGRRQTKYLQVA
ncbi:PEPxxWA-CTERM sorting domain-containing protein [Sphingomonas glaciei]|uniref:PEPxxWA-CTERM sorting domain-containing protein n=1 Tax=Sphingomonas glaciei TaxID=2938948 RepID=A0ABY5MYD7_9SPHN|nr:PEPxxWA-CTERM sorting domain-containing protein [Sphingomonas glaciei]UUR09474.1 PEPxxWA-CTERM sorting domain-containing protein [Sphingomonas glaciei]